MFWYFNRLIQTNILVTLHVLQNNFKETWHFTDVSSNKKILFYRDHEHEIITINGIVLIVNLLLLRVNFGK